MKHKKISTETVVEILFFLFLLVFYLMWARVQPNGAGPDEPMRYQIAYYIYEHGSLPVGDDPAVRNIVWGISYAFSPILDYMIAAVFMKLVSFITTVPFALLMAARFVNILLGLGTVWLALDMGKRLFDRRKAWIFAAFVGLLPGSLFVFTYVNCDALAVFSTAVIVYAWVRYLTEGWTYKNCIILAIGVAVCTLSYYNAYGFILCSIFFFGITLFMEAKQKGNYGDFAKKGLLVCVIVMILAAWWFVRNAILYDGDFLGMNASSICAEKYAKPAYKPSEKQTPQMAGYTLWDMLNQGFPKSEGFSWVELVSQSFVGRFGNMNVFMPKWLINNYMDFIKAGFLLIFLHPVKTFTLRVKKQWSVKGMFNWFMLIAMIIPNILNAYYSYASDYQPQGRYSLPMLIPMTYFMVMGYGNLFDVTVKNEKVRKGVYAAICVALMVLALFVFFTVIWPEYRDVPFSIRAFIAGA
ncbi:hypothetical protein DW073_05840 [Ruminococcus sp. AF45-4BH]|nr:hypothetical protein DW073_05840 [Ruminococcus sp. AF45-4BH]